MMIRKPGRNDAMITRITLAIVLLISPLLFGSSIVKAQSASQNNQAEAASTEPSKDNDSNKSILDKHRPGSTARQDEDDLMGIHVWMTDKVPTDYVLGPIEAYYTHAERDPDYTHSTAYYIISLNHKDYAMAIDHPSRIQIWETHPSDKEPVLLQEFTLDRAMVTDMGWLEIDGRKLLYTISEAYEYQVIVSVFVYNASGNRFDFLSEQADDHMGDAFLMSNLPGFGPVFILIRPQFLDNPDVLPEKFMLELVTHGEQGFFISHYLMLGDLVSKENLGWAQTIEDLKELIEVTLRTTSGWESVLKEWKAGEPEKRRNIDGTFYYTKTYGGWNEVNCH
jgi:hypothetical protein